MFHHKRTGVGLRQILYIGIAAIALTVLVFCISYTAFAGYFDDEAQSPVTMTTVQTDADSACLIQVVEEINLGDQGVFPADHILATIHVDGQVYTVDTFGKTDEQLLALYGFELTNQDYTEQVANEYGYDLYINRLTVETSTEEVVIPYETTRVADDTMMKGTEKVTCEGKDGKQIDTYETRTLNGETKTELVGSEVIEEVVNEVIAYGTRVDHSEPTGYKNNGGSLNLTSDTVTSVDSVNKTFTLSNGETYSFSQAVTCTGYAYCEPGGLTATGTSARQGAIAVDPKVIPLGSRLFIIAGDGSVVYGFATAEDTGGNIKGNTVDLYYNSESLCRNFGRRSVTVYVLN